MIKKLEFNGEQQYLDMLENILDLGAFEGDERTGIGTYDIFGYHMRFDLSKGEIPLLTTKKMFTSGIITELAWFCRGKTDIKWLIDRKSNFWNGDAHRVYCTNWTDHPIKYLKNVAGTDEYAHFVNGGLEEENKVLYDFYIKHNVSKDSYYRPFTMSEFKKQIQDNKEFNDAFGDLGKVYGYQWTKWEKNQGARVGADYIVPELPLMKNPEDAVVVDGIDCKYILMDNNNGHCDVQFLDMKNVSIRYAILKDVPSNLAYAGSITNPYKTQQFINQLDDVINRLKSKPADRRLIITAWNPSHIESMALPPCHLLFQFSSHKLSFKARKAIYEDKFGELRQIGEEQGTRLFDENNIPKRDLGCHMYQRSCDSFLGVPFNIASYSILTHIIANMLNYHPREFVWSSGSTHIYHNHVDQTREQITREPLGFPKIKFNKAISSLQDFEEEDIKIVDYEHHDKLTGTLNVG